MDAPVQTHHPHETMDDEARQALASMKMPRRPINFVPASSGEILKLGHITCRIMEDGSRTDNRIGSAEFTLPPNTPGPPAHWHEMHDETFLVTQGVVRVCLLFIVILIPADRRYYYYLHSYPHSYPYPQTVCPCL